MAASERRSEESPGSGEGEEVFRDRGRGGGGLVGSCVRCKLYAVRYTGRVRDLIVWLLYYVDGERGSPGEIDGGRPAAGSHGGRVALAGSAGGGE